MSGLGETGQMSIDSRGDWTDVAEVDLDLTQVLPLLKQVSGVTVAQTMDMRGLADFAGVQSQTEGALEGGAVDGFGGGGRPVPALPLAWEKQGGMVVGLPELTEPFQSALRKGNVAVPIAFTSPDMEEHALGVDVLDFHPEALTQTQAAGVDGDQTDPMIQGADLRERVPHFLGREDDWELELGIGPDQFQLNGPGAVEGFLPEELDGA